MRDDSSIGPSGDIPWEQLTAMVAGALSPDEEARLVAWVGEDPSHGALLEELRELWTLSGAARQAWDPETAIERMKVLAAERARARARASRRRVMPRYKAVSPKVSGPLRRALAAAAVLALALGGWWAARGSMSSTAPAASLAAKTYTTVRGQRLALKLPDGTAVVLGPESSLRQAADYGAQDRVVELTGEAVFAVMHDALHPFEVRARDVVTRDLGTRFLVRARTDTPGIEVAVAEGKVELRAARTGALMLAAGDLGRVAANGAATRRHGIALEPYFGWTEGRLVYDRVPLATVVAELGRWYNADIRLADPALGARLLTASFHDQPITEVLEMIRASFDLTLSRDGQRFVLASR